MPDQPADPNEWKTYDDFIYGADTNRLPQSDALVGQTLEMIGEGRPQLKITFEAGGKATMSAGGREWPSGADVVLAAPDTYFIDLASEGAKESLTMIVNTKTRRTMGVHTVIGEETGQDEPRVRQTFAQGSLGGGPVSGEEPAPSRDLIGLKTLNDYSPNHLYEHNYLSSQRYCWQCLVGVQQGHGDVDMATTWKFAEGLYVFGFREFKIAVGSVYLLDFNEMRSTGKFLGVTADGGTANEKAGAVLSVISRAVYPGPQPV